MDTKTKRIDLRASEQDEKNILRAAEKLGTSKISETIFNSVAEISNTEPELFLINRTAIRQLQANIEQGLKLLQDIVSQFLKIGISISIEEIQSFYGAGRLSFMIPNQEVIREMIISKLFVAQRDRYPGLQFQRDNIQVPDLTELLEIAGRLINVPEVANREVGIYWNCYEIVEGKINIIPEQVEHFKNQFRAYASTPDQRAKLAKVKTLCRALDAFMSDKDIPPEKLNIPGVCFYDLESGRFEPSDQYVLYSLTKKNLTFND